MVKMKGKKCPPKPKPPRVKYDNVVVPTSMYNQFGFSTQSPLLAPSAIPSLFTQDAHQVQTFIQVKQPSFSSPIWSI